MKYTKRTKWLAILLATAMMVAMFPTVFSFAEEAPVDSEYEAALTKEAGNLAINATVISQYGAHSDANWAWDIENIHDGTTNYTDNGTEIGNGGYHSNPGTVIGDKAIGDQKHTEWVGY
ncbi:MAG: hypothetical protein IJW46_06680, partial [Clostridia bacterium]|nr:hypothetical protein [Clostridia bacterium]